MIAPVGHFFWHIPQNMHLEISITILPLALSDNTLGPKGYFTVAGFLNKLFKTVLAIIKKYIFYLSVQLMHGSIVRTSTGTSARLEPGSIFNKLGILANVGVLTLKRCKNFVPSAFA